MRWYLPLITERGIYLMIAPNDIVKLSLYIFAKIRTKTRTKTMG